MIRYDLVCDNGHEFDGWFSNSDAYDTQAKRGLVSCTICNTNKIQKQLMAPGIPTKSNRKSDRQAMTAGPADHHMAEMMQLMRDYKKHVEATSENVGENFAEEARKMHFNEKAKRGIYGEATREEAVELLEEGIEIQPLPVLPEDGN